MVSFQFKVLAVLSCAVCIQSFHLGHNIIKAHRTSSLAAIQPNADSKVTDFDQFNQIHTPSQDEISFDMASTQMPFISEAQISALVLVAAVMFMPTEPAQALEGGIFAKKAASLIHPISNLALFGSSLYAAYLGFQWRRIRDLAAELKALNEQLPVLSTGKASFPISAKILALTAEAATAVTAEQDATAFNNDIATLKKALGLDEQYASKTAERKDIIQAKPKDKHEIVTSFLLGGGVSVALLGALNTYMRAGKLFPGPHLYAGMAIVILWAVAASLVPQMQKGNDIARVTHIGANVVNIALFASQVPTGLEIMYKVIEKTPW